MTTAPTPVSGGHAPHRLTQALLAALVILVAVAVALLVRHDWGGSSGSSTSLQGSGVAAAETRALRSFSGLDLAGSSNVTVHVGGEQRVVVRADDNLVDHVRTTVQAGRLVISTPGSFTTRGPMTVDVTVPRLESAVLSGSGIVAVDGVQATQFTVRVPGSGLLTVSGRVDRLDASLAGSGDVRLGGLAARDVTASVSGSGRLAVQATASLDASISGSGAIFYSGNPATVTRTITGSGAILEGP